MDGIRWLVSVSQKASGVRCPAVQQFAAGLPSPPPSRPIPHAGLRWCAGHRRPSSSQTDKRPRRRLTPSSPDTAKRSTPGPSSRRSRVRVRAGRPVRPACPKPLASNARRSTSTASVFWFTGWDRLSWFWARHQPEPCADNCRPCCSELAASLFPDTPPSRPASRGPLLVWRSAMDTDPAATPARDGPDFWAACEERAVMHISRTCSAAQADPTRLVPASPGASLAGVGHPGRRDACLFLPAPARRPCRTGLACFRRVPC